MCDLRCTMCDVRCTMCDVRCAMYDVRCARLEIFLKQSRRDKIPVTPHKAKPQCGVQRTRRSRSVGRRRTSDEGAQCGAKTHKRRRSAVWGAKPAHQGIPRNAGEKRNAHGGYGGSAKRSSVLRNGARSRIDRSMGGGETWMTLQRRLPPPPISPCFLRRAPPFRCERSEQAEPPTITTQVSPRKLQIKILLAKQYYY